MSSASSTDKPPAPPRNVRRHSAVSLSPRKTRKALNSSIVPVRRLLAKSTKNSSRPNFDVALSKTETVLVTATGDVLVSRCRYSSKPYLTRKERKGDAEHIDHHPTLFWWETSDCQSVCNPCAGSSSPRIPTRTGLLGGSPPHLETMVETEPGNGVTELKGTPIETTEKGQEEEGLASTLDAPEQETEKENIEDIPTVTDTESPETDASNENGVDDLEVLPSFDYSHFAGEGNDMVPPPANDLPNIAEEQIPEQRPTEARKPKLEQRVSPPLLMHGVPTFLPSFYQVKITQVSANPLGSHVLLISAEALLFSYGLNNHGQLGHGYKSKEKAGSKGFVTTPSIVTPLLENGGKAIVCSAGVDYSLVVVKTEGRRIGRLNQTRGRSAQHRRGSSDSETPIHMTRVTSLPSRIQTEQDEMGRQSSDDSTVDSMYHHQLYGFGRNDGRKLGLVDPSKRKKAEDVVVPRRVALNCKVWPRRKESDNDVTPPGIFAVAASAHHSAALVRRASGAVELYTWGDATFNALGPMKRVDSKAKSAEDRKGKNSQVNGRFTPVPLAVTVPTVVKDLSYFKPEKCANGQSIVPVQVALGASSTFVVTSTGKVLSFGKSDIGLLGQGHGVVVAAKPGQVVFPSAGSRVETKVSSISVGPSHAVAVASNGKVYAWGNNDGGIMGFDSALRKHLSRGARRDAGRERHFSISDEVEWIPREVEVPDLPKLEVTKVKSTAKTSIGAPPLSGDSDKDRVIRAYAGYDMTVFVKDSGAVFSCGASSGRLGLGETGTSVVTPAPLFGGLYLWR